MKKICVIGYPAKHSLSPAIHNYWLEKYAIDGTYEIRETEPDSFDDFFYNLHKEDYVGCNITLPFKERAFKLLQEMGGELGVQENAMGAINTVGILPGGKYKGINTDGIGFSRNLEVNANANINGKIVILGAGGAARAIIVGLIASGVKEIYLLNRTKHKADKIKNEIENLFTDADITTVRWEERNNTLKKAAILINTTSMGMVGQPALDINLDYLPKYTLVTDIVYRPLITPLLKAAGERGNPLVDGLGMLLYQAVSGFEMWFADELNGRKVEVTTELRAKVEALL
jgi:shikimate dehydrogenase